MWNRKISPSGFEFNQGLGKSRPWSRMRYLYPTWTLIVDCYNLTWVKKGYSDMLCETKAIVPVSICQSCV